MVICYLVVSITTDYCLQDLSSHGEIDMTIGVLPYLLKEIQSVSPILRNIVAYCIGSRNGFSSVIKT